MGAQTVSRENNWAPTSALQTTMALVVLVGMVVTIGSALAFEHIGGYVPCALCLEQRTPYYLGIPFVAVGLVSALAKWPACLTRGMLAIGFISLLATVALGAYHSGVEWGFFEAPVTCGAGLTGDAGDAGSLLGSLSQSKPPSCDKAAGRLLGISFANANVLAAAALAWFAYRGAFKQA